jgi:pimeloyl-ACP methyl ester carboxylesterase
MIIHPMLRIAIAMLTSAMHIFMQSASAQERFTPTRMGPEDAPAIILIPGLASAGEVWDVAAEHLARSYSVHVLTLRGFAGEPAGANASGPLLAPLIGEITAYAAALEAPVLVGHSMGGLISLAVAAARPDAVGRVMVLDALPFYPLVFNSSATPEMSAPYADMTRTQLLAMTDDQFAFAQARSLTMMTQRAEARPRLLASALASDRRVIAQAMYDLTLTDLRPRLSAIRAPVKVLYAWDADMGALPEQIDEMYAAAYAELTHAQLKRIDGSFHFIMLDQPDMFAQELDGFLR